MAKKQAEIMEQIIKEWVTVRFKTEHITFMFDKKVDLLILKSSY